MELRVNRKCVLFLCTGNSCRSQMAEGWARALHPERIAAFSAGIEPGGLDARAVRVMAEAGVDISRQRSKHVDALAGVAFDAVITVCDHANESCPVFPGRVRRLHAGFDDPPRLALAADCEEEALDRYRRVRDEIRRYVESLPEVLDGSQEPKHAGS
jgi:arsenate reductase